MGPSGSEEESANWTVWSGQLSSTLKSNEAVGGSSGEHRSTGIVVVEVCTGLLESVTSRRTLCSPGAVKVCDTTGYVGLLVLGLKVTAGVRSPKSHVLE